MLDLKTAERIVALYGALKNVNERLNAIEAARNRGASFKVSFQLKNNKGHWGDEPGLVYETRFQRDGDLNDLASTFLARLSDDVARRKRAIEKELRELGAEP